MRNPILIPSLTLLLTAPAGGCVSKKVHNRDLAAVQGELDATTATLEEDRTKLSKVLKEAERQSLEARREIETLKRELAEAERQLAQVESQRGELERSLASTVKDRSKLKATVAQMKAALAAQAARNVLIEARVAEYKQMLARFKPLIDARRLDVRIVDGRMVLHLPSDVLFDTGRAALSSDGETTIRDVGEILSHMPDRDFQVEGHTDDVPISTKSFRNNWELSSARALTVVDVLISSEVAPGQLSAAAYADTRPAAKNDSEAGRAKNRRIEIAVIPDLSNLPGFEELTRISGEK